MVRSSYSGFELINLDLVVVVVVLYIYGDVQFHNRQGVGSV